MYSWRYDRLAEEREEQDQSHQQEDAEKQPTEKLELLGLALIGNVFSTLGAIADLSQLFEEYLAQQGWGTHSRRGGGRDQLAGGDQLLADNGVFAAEVRLAGGTLARRRRRTCGTGSYHERRSFIDGVIATIRHTAPDTITPITPTIRAKKRKSAAARYTSQATPRLSMVLDSLPMCTDSGQR